MLIILVTSWFRMKVLESMVETANNEKKAIETQLAESQEAVKASEMENTRLQAAVDSAKEKVSLLVGFQLYLAQICLLCIQSVLYDYYF